jgi:DNA-directed RNA polymerase subunit RPC12/RpoP
MSILNIMKCKKCNDYFPNRTFINGKEQTLHKRAFCLKCSPFGSRKMSGPGLKLGYKIKGTCLERVCKSCNKSFKTKNAQMTCPTCKSRIIRQVRKQEAIALFGGKCQKCGYDRCYKSLHFHHVDPDKKLFLLSANWEKSFKRIETELKKCILICGNCHQELHDGLWDVEEISKPKCWNWHTEST